MPGLITHYLCADICLSRIENTDAKRLLLNYRSMYNVGAQGPDVFFYYLPASFRKSIYLMGSMIHTSKVGAFMAELVSLAAGLADANERDAVAAYLAGYLTHYALDANAHPYIYYKSGFPTEGGSRLKHSVNHRRFETSIDVLMLKLVSSEKPGDKKLWRLMRVSFGEAGAAARVLSLALRNVYGVRLSHRQVYHAFRGMSAVNRILQSRGGRRKRVMELVEDFTVRQRVLTSLIHDQLVPEDIDYLNLARKPWCFPWDEKAVCTHAFTDLFEKSVEEACGMISALFAYFGGSLPKEALLASIGNRSLATGMDSDLALSFRFSESIY